MRAGLWRSAALSVLLCALASSTLPPKASGAGQSGRADEAGYLTLALPAGGEVLIENRRGGVSVEVWGEDYMALAAEPAGAASAGPSKRGARRKLPVSIERTDSTLSIKVMPAAAAARATPVDLRARVPSRARLKVYTSEGALDIRGVPASIVAQTISGELRLSMPAGADAQVTAQSLNGAVTLGEGVEARGGPRVVRGKFQGRWGSGASAVNLFSGRGPISVSALPRSDAPRASAGPGAAAPPRRADELTGGAFAERPAPPQAAETPQEVDEDEVVRVESDLVTLNVSVAHRATGRGLTGLSAPDFRLFEDGVEQQIEHFESANAPFDLLLLLDLSGSTAKVTGTIRAAARSFVGATRPQDRVAVVAFAADVAVVAPMTSDRRLLLSAIDRMEAPKGDTRLYDSLAAAMDYANRAGEPSRRRALILMSDGLDSSLPNVDGEGSALEYEELRSRVQEFEGVLYTVWTSTEYEAFSPLDIQPETFDLVRDRMEELAEAGGGVFYEVERLEDLSGAYARVVADLGTVYSLSYRPTNKQRDGRWRAIRIRLPAHPDAVARGKRGYNR